MSNNTGWWVLGGAAVIGAGAYLYYRETQKKANVITPAPTTIYVQAPAAPAMSQFQTPAQISAAVAKLEKQRIVYSTARKKAETEAIQADARAKAYTVRATALKAEEVKQAVAARQARDSAAAQKAWQLAQEAAAQRAKMEQEAKAESAKRAELEKQREAAAYHEAVIQANEQELEQIQAGMSKISPNLLHVDSFEYEADVTAVRTAARNRYHADFLTDYRRDLSN